MVEVPVCPSPVAPGISASVPQYMRPTEGPEGQRPNGGSAARCPWILLFSLLMPFFCPRSHLALSLVSPGP